MSDYLSVSQAAEKLGVTPRTIRRRIQTLSVELSAYVRKVDRMYFIDARLVENDFLSVGNQGAKGADAASVGVSDAKSQEETIKEPKQEQTHMIEYLNNQLDQKDKQIAGLLTQNLKLTDTVNSQNQLISKMQEERKVLLSPIEPKPPTKNRKGTKSDYFMMVMMFTSVMLMFFIVWKFYQL